MIATLRTSPGTPVMRSTLRMLAPSINPEITAICFSPDTSSRRPSFEWPKALSSTLGPTASHCLRVVGLDASPRLLKQPGAFVREGEGCSRLPPLIPLDRNFPVVLWWRAC
jgi:hypothetical protein